MTAPSAVGHHVQRIEGRDLKGNLNVPWAAASAASLPAFSEGESAEGTASPLLSARILPYGPWRKSSPCECADRKRVADVRELI